MARMMLKSVALALILSLSHAFNEFRSSQTSGFSGGAQSQFVNQDGTTSGECSYLDNQGRKVRLSYTEYANGNLDVKARESFVQDPKAALKECQNQVRSGQNFLQNQLSQDFFGGLGNTFALPGFNDFSGDAFSTSFDDGFPGVFQGSASFGGFGPDQGGFTGSTYFGSNFPSNGPGVFQVSSGDYGAQILVVQQDGVTTGLCSYQDEQGRTVKINYTEYPNGSIEATSPQKFVTDPVAALGPCKDAVKLQQQQHQQQIQQLQQSQAALQASIQAQQQQIQDQLHRMQEGFRRQQQALQDQLRTQHENIFGSGQFPFNFVPNIPFIPNFRR